MQRILITGSGMVGSALLAHAPDYGITASLLSRQQASITEQSAVERAVRAAKPDIVIHTAAETRVDYCEDHGEEALQVNAMGTVQVRNAAAACGADFVYLSTDYVFNGEKSTPWLESDEPNPVNAYGVSKLAGEWAAGAYEMGFIIRTSGVFGPRGDGKPERNFFRTIASRLAADDRPVEVVDDQITAVTYAPHLARMILELAGSGFLPTAHLTSAGQDSWWGWARRAAGILGQDAARIKAVATDDLGGETRARRPRFSVLGSESAAITSLVGRYPAEEGLREYLSSLS